MSDSDPEKTYLYVVEQLEKRKLGILHFVEFPPSAGPTNSLLSPRQSRKRFGISCTKIAAHGRSNYGPLAKRGETAFKAIRQLRVPKTLSELMP
jgi:hypothetical protein